MIDVPGVKTLDMKGMLWAQSRVKQNGGSPGIDGIAVENLPDIFTHHWPAIRNLLLSGEYQPQPVKRVEIPEPRGRVPSVGYSHGCGSIYPAGIITGVTAGTGQNLFRFKHQPLQGRSTPHNQAYPWSNTHKGH